MTHYEQQHVQSVTSRHWLQAAGIAALVGGFLWAIAPLRLAVLPEASLPGTMDFQLYAAISTAISVLLLVGVVGLHLHYRDSYGWIGRSGAAMIFIGHVFVILPSSLGDVGFIGAMIAALGGIPLGIALWRRTTAPRLAATLLIATLPIGLPITVALESVGFELLGIPLSVGVVLTGIYGAAWVILGYHLWTRNKAAMAPVEMSVR